NYGYTTGGTVTTVSTPVANTQNPALYQTYRAGTTLAYSFNVPPGHYQVTLKFADFISTASGQNVFNVSVQGISSIQSLDVYATAGSATALDRTVRVDVTSSPMMLQLSETHGQAILSAVEITGLQPEGNPLVNYFTQPGGGTLLP
ncbi:MAG TPA: malectin domain-containing carbohydrate-binding protein, partial [bacterium]|nr:malectin domain-containing carbohydrate-binding protein [bacterium]